MEFGFYPKQCDLTVGDVQISTLPDLELKRNRVLQCEWTRDHWTYAPLALATDSFSEQTTELPYSARVFGLPKTHHLQHATPQGFDHCQFLMWCFGFFVGMRMTETDAGFLDATPVKPGSLCDFFISRTSLEKAVAASDSFYTSHVSNPKIPRGWVAAVHALFLSQNPVFLEYERFVHLYISMDAAFFVHSLMRDQNPRGGKHAHRVKELCQTFGITTPPWANPRTTPIAAYRNEAIHEGLFFGEPLGFRIFGGGGDGNVLLELQNPVCRIVVALLGLGYASYVTSPVDDRMRRRLDL